MEAFLLFLIGLIAFLAFSVLFMYLGLVPWIKVTRRDKEYLTFIFAGSGAILFWRGIWLIADITPVVDNPFVSLFLGLTILTLTGFLWREF